MTNLTLNDVYILSSVSTGDKYGLEILEDVKKSGSVIFLGSLYNALARLEKEGFVESNWGNETSERGGNRRKYYKITAEGKFALDEVQVSLNKLWNLNHAYSK